MAYKKEWVPFTESLTVIVLFCFICPLMAFCSLTVILIIQLHGVRGIRTQNFKVEHST